MTELIWEGKYDEKGRKVAPPRIALPFQTGRRKNELTGRPLVSCSRRIRMICSMCNRLCFPIGAAHAELTIEP